MSIVAKFSLAVIALLLLSAGGVAWMGVHSQRDALRDEAIHRGRAIARGLAAASADACQATSTFWNTPCAPQWPYPACP